MGDHQRTTRQCPCGSGDNYNICCGIYISATASAPTPQALMRSRYSAYATGNSDYLLVTWHESTRPDVLDLENDKFQWRGLTIVSAELPLAEGTKGVVEFIAEYKINGKAGKLHERSRFIKENGLWFYLDGSTGSA